MIKQPTLKELIDTAEEKVTAEHWIRFNDIKDLFSVSKNQVSYWLQEMEKIDEFKHGIMRPTHSITLVHYYTFLWFLRWKEANKGLKRKIPPKEIESYRWTA